MKWADMKARADLVRNQLGLEFGVPRLTFYVAWGSILGGLFLGLLLDLVLLQLAPLDVERALFPFVFVPMAASMVAFLALELGHPIARRQAALAKGLRDGSLVPNPIRAEDDRLDEIAPKGGVP